MLLIDFFDKTPISSLVPINSMQADKVVFIIDREHLESRGAENIRTAVRELGPVKQFALKPADISDIEDICDKIEKTVLDASDEDEVYIDLTGGSELMGACGYRVCEETRAIPVFADMNKRGMYRVDNGEKIAEIRDIALKDYITAIGGKKTSDSHIMPLAEEEERICEMAELLFERHGEWNSLCDAISKQIPDSGGTIFIPKTLQKNYRYDFDPSTLMNEFERLGFVSRAGDGVYHVPNARYREYLTTYGIWLEMYIYIKAKPYFDEAYLGFIIDWNRYDSVESGDNEIDVLLMKKSIPYFISCKMRRIEAQDIYEIGFVAEHFGGGYAKRFIATNVSLNKKRGPANLRVKMENMDVGLIETRRIKKDGILSVFG
jgi:hypothetical protein